MPIRYQGMDKVSVELDEAKYEIEKLRSDLKCKEDLCRNLKNSHGELTVRFKEASLRLERQAKELAEKEEQISNVKQTCADLQASLKEKDSAIRVLCTANDKLKVDSDEKYRVWEEDKRLLVCALDEAKEKKADHERQLCLLRVDIEVLRGLLSDAERKSLGAEKNSKAKKELLARDDVVLKLEEEKRKFEDQVKWKDEHFRHLEEAHKKLQDQFQESNKGWELEKSKMIDDLCSLQTSLDSQIRISYGLENQLKMCNQALAHEESRRKCLEAELSESQNRLDNVFFECQDSKSQLEHLTIKRDEEIATLRHALSTKGTLFKELEYRAGKLEQENKELLESLKELQESRIQEVGNRSSLSKLRNKLKGVERTRRDCTEKFRANEAEWRSKLEKMNAELNHYCSALECKQKIVKELGLELENCHMVIMQLKQQNEEASVTSLLLKSCITEACENLKNGEDHVNLHDEQKDENISILKQLSEMKNDALAKAQRDIEDERQKCVTLLKRVESLELVELQMISIQKELRRINEMLEQSSNSHLRFKEEALQTETDLKEHIRSLCDALDTANSELDEERERAVSFLREVDALELAEEKQLQMQQELEGYKVMLEESSRIQLLLKEKALQTEIESEKRVRDALEERDMANSELAEKCARVASLSKELESLKLVKEKLVTMQKELEWRKEMLEEASRKHNLLEEKAIYMETDFKKELRQVCEALDAANVLLAEERETVSTLTRKVESFDILEEQQLLMQKELKRCKSMLEESSRCLLQLERQAFQKEDELKEELRKVRDAFDSVNSELADSICEGQAIEFELWLWKDIVQRLKKDLEENQTMREDLEASLLAQIEVAETIKHVNNSLAEELEVKERELNSLKEQIAAFEKEQSTQLEVTASVRDATIMLFQSEKEHLLKSMMEKDKILDDLQKEISWLEQESLRNELEGAIFAHIGTEKMLEGEKNKQVQLVKEKDQRINELMQVVDLVQEKFDSSLRSLSSELAKKRIEINLVYEAWEKIAAAEILAQVEIEEKKLIIVDMETDIYAIQQKLEQQEKSLSFSKQQAQKVEAELESKRLEMKKQMNLMETKVRSSETLVDELKNEKRNLLQDVMKLSTERENLLGYLVGVASRIGEISGEDIRLMGTLESLVQSTDKQQRTVQHREGERRSHRFNHNEEHSTVLEERSPLRELN